MVFLAASKATANPLAASGTYLATRQWDLDLTYQHDFTSGFINPCVISLNQKSGPRRVVNL